MSRVIPAALSASLVLLSAGASALTLPHFPPNAVWHRDVSTAPLHPNSASMITELSNLGGWGNGNKFQIDFSIRVNIAPDNSPVLPITPQGGYYTPDCSLPSGFTFPVPVGGAIEGSSDYTCDYANNDCHLLVVQGSKLYESYNTTIDGSGHLISLCALVWDLNKVYPPQGRGDQCTSADAAGFPIAPLLFNADEVAAARPSQGGPGYLDHAIRFILPPADVPKKGILGRIAQDIYVHPGSHSAGTTGPSTSIRYAARMRLHGNFDLSHYNESAQVILRTMQHYGIVLSDGGNIALTAEDDGDTTVKWADLGITSQVFNPGTGNPAVQVTDFDILDTGADIALTDNCVRVPDDFLFIDGFQY